MYPTAVPQKENLSDILWLIFFHFSGVTCDLDLHLKEALPLTLNAITWKRIKMTFSVSGCLETAGVLLLFLHLSRRSDMSA